MKAKNLRLPGQFGKVHSYTKKYRAPRGNHETQSGKPKLKQYLNFVMCVNASPSRPISHLMASDLAGRTPCVTIIANE